MRKRNLKQSKWMALAVCSTAVMLAVNGCQAHKTSMDGSSQTTVQDSQNSDQGNQTDGDSKNQNSTGTGEQNGADASENSSNESSDTLCLTSIPKYRSEWKDQKQLFNGRVDQMYLMADGHDALKQALKTFNQNQEQELDQIYQDNKEFFDMQTGEDSTPLAYEVSVIPKRADEQIVSLSVEEYDYLGGAHPNSMVTGYNLNPQTGKRYTLQDIAQSYDGIFEYVKKKLKEDYSPDMFFDGYEDTVKSMFYGDTTAAAGENGADSANGTGTDGAQTDSSVDSDLSDTEMLSWTIDQNGVTITFNNYDLAPYAAGRQVVEIPFATEGNLFKPEFLPVSLLSSDSIKDGKTSVTEAKIQPLYEEQEVSVDLDGDGNKETVKISKQTDSQTGTTSLFAETGSASAFLLSNGEETTDDLNNPKCWLIQTKDNRSYLYIETKEANDFRSLHIFDLSTKGITYCGTSDDSFYDSVMTDPDNFILFRRSDMLSTYSIFRHYKIGKDGMPQPLSDDFTVSGTYLADEIVPTLTTKQEVPVWIDGKQEKLPKGTVLKLKATDDSTYVTAETADGKTCQIRLDTNEEIVYPRTIDGIPEDECFDGLQYAG